MKLTINTGSIANAAARVKAAVDSKVTLAALGCILLKAEGDSLTLRASNLDTEIEITLPAEVSEDGATAIASRTFSDALALLPANSTMTLESDAKGIAQAIAGTRKLRLPGLPAGEFPAPIICEGKAQEVHFGEGELRDVLGMLAPFMCVDPTRWVLQGVCISGQKEATELVACNGKSLRLVRAGSAFNGSVIIPADAVAKVRALSEGQTVMAKVYESACVFTGEGWKLSTKLISGDYPNYSQLIPEAGNMRIEFGRSEMLSAIRFVGLVGDPTDVIKLKATETGCAMSLVNRNGAETACDLVDAKGDVPSISYDARLLRCVIESIPDDYQSLTMQDVIGAGMVKNASGLAVLMPCRVA